MQCWGGNIFLCFKILLAGQINCHAEVNRGNSNITAYVWGFHKKMKPQIHQAIKANLPFLGKE